MSNFFKRIFSSASQSPDGLTQGQREAIVDVLFYCMYADNNIALKEDKIIADTVGQFTWDPNTSYDSYAARSIANARAVKETPAARADFLESVAGRLGPAAVKQRTLALCRSIFQADGEVSGGEQELLRQLQKALS